MGLVPSVTMYSRLAYLVCQGMRSWPTYGALALAAACTTNGRPSLATVQQDSAAEAEQRRRVVHALNRLTFGARSGDVDRVLAMGLERWIDGQLRGDTALDGATVAALSAFPAWTRPVAIAAGELSGSVQLTSNASSGNGMQKMSIVVSNGGSFRVVPRDSSPPVDAAARVEALLWPLYRENARLLAGRLTRAQTSEQQLLEVMTDFWENHFSVFSTRAPSRGAVLEFDRAAIRPHALGRFRDLLGAVARSPAMLGYLDNAVSTAKGLNENYARELLELHTLGVDGGYTQQDIIDVARAFTGWSHTWIGPNSRLFPLPPKRGGDASTRPQFEFYNTAHDTGVKLVLGNMLSAGRGIEDGEQVLTMLARHPSTARFISRKLATRFVSDAPPDALVDRAASVYLQTDGDIRAVVRAIVTSPEFFATEVFRAKIKSPIELVLSTQRALGAPADTSAEMIDHLIALEQVPYSHVAPDGWPEHGDVWLNAGAMKARVNLALRVANGEMPSVPLDAWPAWHSLATAPFDVQVAGVIRELFGGFASPATRAVLERVRPPSRAPVSAEMAERTLRELVALALASPEHQRR